MWHACGPCALFSLGSPSTLGTLGQVSSREQEPEGVRCHWCHSAHLGNKAARATIIDTGWRMEDRTEQVQRMGSKVTPSILTTLSRPRREDHTNALLMRRPGTAQCAQHQEQEDGILGKRGETQTKCGRYKIELVGPNPAPLHWFGAIPCSYIWYLQNSSSFKSFIAVVSFSLNDKLKLQVFMLVFIYMEDVT